MPAIDIGPLAFRSNAAAKDYYRAILHAYPVGAVIPEPHASQLLWLLDRHPEAADKRGAGVARFRVDKPPKGKHPCFWIDRVDGSATDFSFRWAIDGKGPSRLTEMRQAMREAINGDAMAFRRRFFEEHADTDGRVPCALTGVPVSPSECHVDHAPPHTFVALATAFLAERRISPDGSHVTAPADNQFVPRLVDAALAADWQAYHRARAKLRVVEKDAHLRQGRAGRER